MDPKLKEAYDRVMATAVPPPAQPTIPQPQAPTPPPQPTPIQSGPATTTVHATIVGAMPKKNAKRINIFPILFAVGGIVFFVVYTIFWLKFFNLPVPFLPL